MILCTPAGREETVPHSRATWTDGMPEWGKGRQHSTYTSTGWGEVLHSLRMNLQTHHRPCPHCTALAGPKDHHWKLCMWYICREFEVLPLSLSLSLSHSLSHLLGLFFFFTAQQQIQQRRIQMEKTRTDTIGAKAMISRSISLDSVHYEYKCFVWGIRWADIMLCISMAAHATSQ